MIVDGLNILYGIDRFATDPVGSMVKVNSLLDSSLNSTENFSTL
jgi:hypothetical protein